jgi:cytochrome P460
MKLMHLLSGAALVAVSLTVAVRAGGDKIAFPENYAKGVLYTTVDRPDNKQYRELFATPEAITALKAGQPIPSGTVLTLVQYKAVVNAAGEPEKDANGLKACFTCHKPLDKQDFVFSFDKMKTAK